MVDINLPIIVMSSDQMSHQPVPLYFMQETHTKSEKT